MDVCEERIYFSTLSDGIYDYGLSTGVLTRLEERNIIKRRNKQYISCLRAGKDGKLWIGAQDKIFLCKQENSILKVLRHWDCPWILCMQPDREGNMWIGVLNGLVMRISADGARMDNINLGIPSNT